MASQPTAHGSTNMLPAPRSSLGRPSGLPFGSLSEPPRCHSRQSAGILIAKCWSPSCRPAPACVAHPKVRYSLAQPSPPMHGPGTNQAGPSGLQLRLQANCSNQPWCPVATDDKACTRCMPLNACLLSDRVGLGSAESAPAPRCRCQTGYSSPGMRRLYDCGLKL
jgi:hypothetical protein